MFTVEPFINDRDRDANPWGKAIPKGATLYAVEYKGKYFHFSYTSEETASKIAGKLVGMRVDVMNFSGTKERTSHSDARAKDVLG